MSNKPRVNIENDSWNKRKGLRITIRSLHDGFMQGNMYSVTDARYLATEINKACDRVEKEESTTKSAYMELGRKLGFI